MENNLTSLPDLETKLTNLQSFADELPTSLIIHKVEDLHIVYMNKIGLEGLDATLEELQDLSQQQYFVKYFNTEDSNDYVPKIINIIKSEKNDQVSYFQQVRIPSKKEWQLYVSNTKVFYRNEQGQATHLITVASLLDPLHHITSKVNRLMDEVSFLRNNSLLYAKLSNREIEVLKCMAMGLNSGEIAGKLFISSATSDTHRRNIRRKLSLKSNYDAVIFAQAYNLV